MYDPNFWHRVRTMLNQMDLAPSWIETYPKHDLELLLRAAEYWEREANATRANLLLANTWERVQAIGFPDEEKAAKIRAAVAAELERREPKKDEAIPSGIELHPAFLALFRNEAAARRAIDAGIKAGIVDESGKYKLGERKKRAIVEYWRAISGKEFGLTFIHAEATAETYETQCHAVAVQFGTSIARSTINDNAGAKHGTFYKATVNALAGQ